MAGVEIIVRGRVQGVGFRRYVKQIADEAGLTGTVRNLSDGSVEIHIWHISQSVLDEFMESLSQGPGKVVQCDVLEWRTNDSLTEFNIEATR